MLSNSDRLEAALHTPEPVPSVRALVQDRARGGSTKTEISGLLESFLVQLRTRPDFRDADEEAILDVLDALSGWCHPSAELLPDSRGE